MLGLSDHRLCSYALAPELPADKFLTATARVDPWSKVPNSSSRILTFLGRETKIFHCSLVLNNYLSFRFQNRSVLTLVYFWDKFLALSTLTNCFQYSVGVSSGVKKRRHHRCFVASYFSQDDGSQTWHCRTLTLERPSKECSWTDNGFSKIPRLKPVWNSFLEPLDLAYAKI